MTFISDFHIHSKYSRATAKNLNLENLYIAAQLKGITVLGTGDFTHPAWYAELSEKLEPAESGLLKLKDTISKKCDEHIPASCRRDVRFILTSEISNIYKKNGKTRKNHNLIFMPNLDYANTFNRRLDAIGNIASDGRPILGLDAKDLLKIMLDVTPEAFLIPAHIWTPWFSLLGSKSGFDSIEECFEELTPHIFAVETGLSSDPEMNWRIADLDGLTLVSNSDAHSPAKLGREANLFNTGLSYSKMKSAMESGDPQKFLGTFEFFPEEGKYHMDGHRKCDVRFTPKESLQHNGTCPVCGKPLTLGVLYRVEELSTRPVGTRPENCQPYHNIIPLDEILSELLNVGPNSKRVQTQLATLRMQLGSEFGILHTLPVSDLDQAGPPLFGEAISRMRQNKVHLFPGYDGEFGKIKIFTQEEREALYGQQSLFIMPKNIPPKTPPQKNRYASPFTDSKPQQNEKPIKTTFEMPKDILSGLNAEQQKAVLHYGAPLLIVAGPGTGKTATLTRKIAYLIQKKGAVPEQILAITFTNKAAQEMAERLRGLLGIQAALPHTATFHALCFKLLTEANSEPFIQSPLEGDSDYRRAIIDDQDRKDLITTILKRSDEHNERRISAQTYLNLIVAAKQCQLSPSDNLEAIVNDSECSASDLANIYSAYQMLLKRYAAYDFEDLIFRMVDILESDSNLSRAYRGRFKYIFVDEYQDLNFGQYRIIRALAGKGNQLCVIGDPDQAIYGFRGSDVYYFRKFIEDYPKAETIHLTQNYRSTQTILDASCQVINCIQDDSASARIFSEITGEKTIKILSTVSEKAEAVSVGKIIEQIIGGIGFHSIDFDKLHISGNERPHLSFDEIGDKSFGDFAILYRTSAQGKFVEDVLFRAGIPCQMASKENCYFRRGLAELIAFLKVVDGIAMFHDFEKIAGLKGTGVSAKSLNLFKNAFLDTKILLDDAFLDFQHLLIPGITPSAKRRLKSFVAEILRLKKKVHNLTITNKIDYILKSYPQIDKIIQNDSKTWDAFIRITQLAMQCDSMPAHFFSQIALNTDPDTFEPDSEKVALMTMHAAKGLEFPIVFIIGCEEGLIPYRRPEKGSDEKQSKTDIDEERRLFYVAMTRAQEMLFLTYSKRRTIFGKTLERRPSPFIKAIDERIKTYERINQKPVKQQSKKNVPVQLELF